MEGAGGAGSDMKPNMYEVPPMSPEENEFLIISGASPELIELYEKIREKILLYGKIEPWVTKDYINFKHPYKKWNRVTRQKEQKMGTMILAFIRQNSITLAFNTLGKLPRDHKNILKPGKSFGYCDYYTNIKVADNLDDLDENQ